MDYAYNYGYSEKEIFYHYLGEETKQEKERQEKRAFNKRIERINSIFYQIRYLGIDKKESKHNVLYYNDLFDKLYEMSDEELREYEENMNRMSVEEQIRNQPLF